MMFANVDRGSVGGWSRPHLEEFPTPSNDVCLSGPKIQSVQDGRMLARKDDHLRGVVIGIEWRCDIGRRSGMYGVM